MSQFPTATTSGPFGPVRLGERAARVVTGELARHHGAKTGLLVGVAAGSPVLACAIDTLLPGDGLTVLAGSGPDGTPAGLRAHVQGLGTWVADRVRVVESIAEADPADVVILAEPVVGTADEARAMLEGLTKYLTEGGVLVVATPLLGGGARAELERQAALFGVGSDLVLRNAPPVRVHRLRFSTADPAVAERLTPGYRSSSVPLTRDMHIDSNGLAAAGVALGMAALLRAARPRSKAWLLPALAAPAVAVFFRDPEREVPDDARAVVAPADGTVLSVERISDDRFGDHRDYVRIAIFLSVLNVHVNRAPVAGRVADYFVVDGGFAAAMRPAAEHNVAAYTVLDTIRGPVVVAQRTGLIARRIVHRTPVGALLAKGERFGLIRFGSRTDVYLPADSARAVVGPGDKVIGGTSIIAEWDQAG